MRPQVVGLIAASCLTTGWLLASILTPPVAELQVLPERAPRRAPADAKPIAPFTEQLHLKLQSAPPRPTPRRNLFTFGDARTERRGLTAAAVESPLATIAERAPAPVPAFRLAGIASSNTDGGTVWTAVLSDGRGIHLLQVGEKILQLTVTEISADAVVLTDDSGQRQTLRLK